MVVHFEPFPRREREKPVEEGKVDFTGRFFSCGLLDGFMVRQAATRMPERQRLGEVLPAPAGFGGRAAGGGRYLERLGGVGYDRATWPLMP